MVVVPGAEGGWIVRAFARESIDALRAEPSDAPISGAALVIDREVGALDEWLARYGGDSILIGWDPPSDDERAELDIVAFYPRPVNLAGLIRRVQTLLEGAALPATPRDSSVPPPAGAGRAEEPTADATLHDSGPPLRERPTAPEVELPPPRPTLAAPPDDESEGEAELPPREPTVRLTADDEAAARGAAADASATGDEASSAAAVASAARGEASNVPLEADGEPSIERVHLSPRLANLLREADRRLFADEPPIELSFPAGDEPPAALVPDELLAESGTPLEPREADPLEAFTFVGTPDLLDTASGNVAGARAEDESFELTPHTVVERASRPPGARPSERPGTSASSETPSTAGTVDITRAGTVPFGGALRMALELTQRRRPCRLRLHVAGGPEVELHLEGDTVLGVRGPRAQRALAELVRAGRLNDTTRAAADDDKEALAAEALDDAVAQGRITAFERDRRVRLAAQALIGDALLAAEARYAVDSAEAGSRESSPVVGTLTMVAVEEARKRLDPATVLEWLGVGRGHLLALERSFASRARDLGLEPEVVSLFVRGAGQTIGELFEAPPLAGIAGALFAVASADLVKLEASADAADQRPSSEALAEAIERAQAMALEGSYHAILGVRPSAGARELEAARRECLAAMRGDLERFGLEGLQPSRALAIEAIEEAYEVLMHPRWRKLYSPAPA